MSGYDLKRITNGAEQLPWPSKPPRFKVIPATDRRSAYTESRGSFTREPLTEEEKAERDRRYLKRRRRCALAEMYCAIEKLETGRGQVRDQALRNCVKARVALKALGADEWLRVRWRT